MALNKIIKKLLKVTGIVLASFLLLGVISYALLRTPAVQTWITQRLARYLSGEIGARVEVASVDIGFFSDLVISGLYVEDQQKDTLLYVPRLKAGIGSIDRNRQYVRIDAVELEGMRADVKYYKGQNDLNIQFILDAFASKDTTPSRGGWEVDLRKIILTSAFLSYSDEDKPRSGWGMDYDYLEARNLNLTLDSIFIRSDTVFARIRHLSAAEKSGFLLHELSASFIFQPKGMSFYDMVIKTPYSSVYGDIDFLYDDFSEFNDFIEKVTMRSRFSQSRVSFSDIAYFAPELKGMKQEVLFAGDVRGRVNNLKGRNIALNYGTRTVFKGKVNMTGLPDIETTLIDLEAEEARTAKGDIETIPLPPFTDSLYVSVPENIGMLGDIRFQGKFTGFLSDFVAFGHFNTDIGAFSSDINLKYDESKEKTRYSGNLKTFDFEAGKFLGVEPIIGRVSLDVKIEGTGLAKNEIAASLEGNVKSMEVNKYRYTNVEVNGQVRKGLFKGFAQVEDENIDLTFNGGIDFTGRTPVFSFNASVRDARLTRLNFSPRDSSSSFSADITMDFSGDDPDNIRGEMTARDIFYSEKGNSFRLSRLSLRSSDNGAGQRSIVLQSDAAQAHITGQFHVETLYSSFREVLAYYMPSLSPGKEKTKEKKKIKNNEQIEFSAELGKTDPVTAVFLPGFTISSGTRVSGKFESSGRKWDFSASSPGVEADGKKFREISFSSTAGMQEPVILDVSCRSIALNDSMVVDSIKVKAEALNDSVHFRITLANADTAINKGDIEGRLVMASLSAMRITLSKADITLEGRDWAIIPGNEILIDSARLSMNRFVFVSGEQQVSLTGTFASGSYQQMQLGFTRFDCININRLLNKYYGIDVAGIVNGGALIIGNFSEFGFTSNLAIEGLEINGDSLGFASLIARWDTRAQVLDLDAGITMGRLKIIEAKGTYVTDPAREMMDIRITTQNLYLRLFDRYVKDAVSNLRGVATASLHLTGTASKPVIEGKLLLQKTSFVVDYLNTSYNLAHEFYLTKDAVIIKDLYINEDTDSRTGSSAKGVNTIKVNGEIGHQYFSDFRFDVTMETSRMKCLSTNASQNNLYYGNAYVSGRVGVTGRVSNITMDIAVRTLRGTQVFIPLSNPEEISQSDFISFIKKDTVNLAQERKSKTDLTGIKLNFDLEATPDAEMQMIFDSKIGDIMKGRGNGNIKMEINTQGDFAMFGEYVIEEGDYLFTLQNIINKRFRIEKGGTINWNGDPYNAQVNLDAVYALRAPLYDLLQDTTYKKRIPVECKLNMTGKLMNPNIRFDIDIPNIDEGTRAQVDRLVNTDQEMSRQVFSLLVLNRFSTPAQLSNSLQASTSGVGANASELLSNQLSNWASHISKDVQIGVNYRASDAISKEELEVAMSTELFNDRVTVEGNVGVAGTETPSGSSASNIVGDVNVEVKVSNDGRLRVKAFNKSNTNSLINNNSYTQGVGLFYREEFDKFRELLERYGLLKKKTKGTE